MIQREQLPPIGTEIAEHVEAFCRDRGFDAETAQREGNQIAELMLTIYSGQVVRFPAQPFRDTEIRQRNREIRAKYDGSNAGALAREHHLTVRHIRRIVTAGGDIR